MTENRKDIGCQTAADIPLLLYRKFRPVGIFFMPPRTFTIIAISLATFLMASVLLLVSGIITVNQKGGNHITGSYHALISGIEKEQYQKLSDDVRVDLCGFIASIGSVKSGNDRLNISYCNNDALILNGLSVDQGKMPEKSE